MGPRNQRTQLALVFTQQASSKPLHGVNQQIELLLLKDKKPEYFVGDLAGVKQNWPAIKSYDDVFFGLNPTDIDSKDWNLLSGMRSIGRTKKRITGIRFIFVDIDPIRPASVCSTEDEKNAAKLVADKLRQHVENLGFPSPWVVDSGNGFHLYFSCDLSVEDEGLVKRLLAILADKFDTVNVKIDQKVGDATRMCRMPGTYNRKGEDTAKRPHRKCHIVEKGSDAVGDAVTRKMLEKLLAQKTVEAQLSLTNSPTLVDEPLRPDIVARASNYVSRMTPSVSGDHGHDRLYSAACKTVELGCNRKEARIVIDNAFNPRCKPPWSTQELAHKLDDAFARANQTASNTDSTQAKLIGTKNGGVDFFGFVPEFANCQMSLLDKMQMCGDNNFLAPVLEHYALMQFRRTNALLPPEFVRQFFLPSPRQANWRAKLAKEIPADWQALDTYRNPKVFEKRCTFCRAGYERHTHFNFHPRVSEDLKKFLTCRNSRGEKVFVRKELLQSADEVRAIVRRRDSFLCFNQQNQKHYRKLINAGSIRKVYLPTLLLGGVAGLSRQEIRALLGVTSELTRGDGQPLRIINAAVPDVRRSTSSKTAYCPLLDKDEAYVVFGGNRRNGKGMGYDLFGRTGKGWVRRLGRADAYKDGDKNKKAFRMSVAQFIFGDVFKGMLTEELELVVAAYHPAKNEWKGLADLQRACRSEHGFDWINQSTIRFFAPYDWCYRWRAFLSRRLGYKWIPATSSEQASSTNFKLATPSDVTRFISDRGWNRDQLARELSKLAGHLISKKKIQRHLSGESQTSEFWRLATELIKSC